MAVNDLIELQLTGMAHTGEAIGRRQEKVTFVPFGVMGDLVRARITAEKPRYARAHLVEVLSPSPLRVAAPCPHFGTCGGCRWQHIDYAAQLELKRANLADQLARLGGLDAPPVKPIIGMADPWRYLNRADFAVGPDGQAGFLSAAGDEVAPIRTCLIIDEVLEELFHALDFELEALTGFALRTGVHTDEAMVILQTRDDALPELTLDLPVSCVLLHDDGSAFTLVGDTFYREELRGRAFRISAGSRFPENIAGAEALLDCIERGLAPTGGETLVDVHCGVGLYGIALAERVGRVIGIEEEPDAAADAQANSADLDHFDLLTGPAAGALESITDPVHLAVFNPPHGSGHAPSLEALLRLRPRRLACVSTDVAALARDAARLTAAGYRLEEAQPVDLFPQTHHFAAVALWLAPAR